MKKPHQRLKDKYLSKMKKIKTFLRNEGLTTFMLDGLEYRSLDDVLIYEIKKM